MTKKYKLKYFRCRCVVVFILSVLIAGICFADRVEYPTVLPPAKQAALVDNWLNIRLETILPAVMRRENIDMWLVICREYNEDPVFLTLVPPRWYAARRTTMLVFFDRGEKSVERLMVRKPGKAREGLYENAWTPGQTDQWQCLADVVKKRNPRRIGINVSGTFAFGDGLTASLKARLVKSLGKKYASRLCSAENLAVGWLEKRIPGELEAYPQIVAIAHAIIAEAFSNRVITPGVTTTQEVQWWMRGKIDLLGLKPWFHPWVDLQRLQADRSTPVYSQGGVIERGDLLHCDLGITYLGLNTDTQEMAYVLREGETDVPGDLQEALRIGNRLQDIFTAAFKEGLTGNQLLRLALSEAAKEAIAGQIYTHPLGFHGHGAGPVIGLWDRQEGVPGNGDYPLYYDTCYAVELNAVTAVPAWKGQAVRIALEQDAVFSTEGVRFLDGRQTTFHVIR